LSWNGSTIAHFIELLGLKLKSGELRDISIVPTSENTARSAENIGLKITSLSAVAVLDLAIDGADEVDPSLNLIKAWVVLYFEKNWWSYTPDVLL